MADLKTLYLDNYEFLDRYEHSDEDLNFLKFFAQRHSSMDDKRKAFQRDSNWLEAERRLFDRIVTPVKDSEQDDTETIRQPIELAIHYSKLSQLVKNPPKCIVRGVEKSDQEHEATAQAVWDFKSREGGLESAIRTASSNALGKGEGILKVSYATYKNTIKIPKMDYEDALLEYADSNTEEKEYVSYDGLVFEVIDNKNFWVDENACEMHTASGFGQVNECVVRYVMDFAVFRDQFGDFDNALAVRPGSRDDGDVYVYKSREEEFSGENMQWVTLYEYYNAIKNMKVLVANGVVIYRGGIPGGKLPFEVLKNLEIPGRFWSKGDPEILRGYIGMSNSLFNKAEQQAEMAINKPMFVSSSINIDDIEIGPGAVNPIRGNARDAVSFMDIPDITNGVQFMLDYVKSGIIQTAGINYDQLNADPGQTAFGLALQQEQTLVRLGLFVKYNEEKIKNFCAIAFSLLQKFFPKEKARLIVEPGTGKMTVKTSLPKITVRGKKATLEENRHGKEFMKLEDIDEDKFSTFEIPPEFIHGRNFDLEVVTNSMVSDMVMVKTERMAKMLQTLLPIPGAAEALGPDVFKNIVENSGEKAVNWLKPLQGDNYSVSEFDKEWDALMNETGMEVEQIVEKDVDHQAHLDYLQQRLADALDPEETDSRISAVAAKRVRQAIMIHAEYVQNPQKMDAVKAEKKEQEKLASMEEQAIMNKGPGRPPQVPTPQPQGSRSELSEIRKQAQAVSSPLNPVRQ